MRGTDHDAGGLKPDVDAMRAEVALLGRVIFRINKDRVVRTRRHAGFAADADRFIKIYDAVRALEHRGRWASGHARRMRTLVATRYLMRPTHLRKHTDIDVLDVSARNANRHDIFRLARRRAGMATDAAGVIDHFGPLHAVCLLLDHLLGNRRRENISDFGVRQAILRKLPLPAGEHWDEGLAE